MPVTKKSHASYPHYLEVGPYKFQPVKRYCTWQTVFVHLWQYIAGLLLLLLLVLVLLSETFYTKVVLKIKTHISYSTSRGTRRCPGLPIAKPDARRYFLI